jgi:hypothetical protein
MLSFIYRLALEFEAAHGEKPNMLYLSRFHFERVRKDFADPDDIATMMRVLGMTIMITDEAVNPRLTRIDRPQPPVTTGTGRSPAPEQRRRS